MVTTEEMGVVTTVDNSLTIPDAIPPIMPDCQGPDCETDEDDLFTTFVGTTITQRAPHQPNGTPPPLPRPTAGPQAPFTHSASPKETESPATVSEAKAFPRTTVIAVVAVTLILVLIVVVFIVFKCRNKSNDSYSTDETKNYTTLYSSGVEVSGSKPLVSTKVTHVNGLSRTGKSKKDVKEWYV